MSKRQGISGTERATLLAFLLIGGILVFISADLKPANQTSSEFVGTLFFNGGFVFLTVAVLDLAWRFLGGNPTDQTLLELKRSLESSNTLAGDSHRTGLVRISPNGSNYKKDEEWMQLLASAQKQVEIMSYTAHSWVKGTNFVEIIDALVRRGVKVRVLFMDETNQGIASQFLGQHGRPESPESMKAHIQVSKRAMQDLARRFQPTQSAGMGTFEWRTLKQSQVSTHLSRIDEVLIAIPYLVSKSGDACPVLEVQGSTRPVFRTYSEEFEHLWALATPGSAPP